MVPLSRYPCILDLGNTEIGIELPEEIRGTRIYCQGPQGPCPLCEGRGCDYIVHVEPRPWEGKLDKPWILVSSRWVSGCGIHTRVYLTPEGNLVFSHDTAGYEGLHIIHFKGVIRERLKRMYNADNDRLIKALEEIIGVAKNVR